MSIVIQSPQLKVEIAQPGSVYNRTRFDWSAFITQVTLDGKHTFCVPEDYDPQKGTGGIGICNEFGIEAPIGYDDAKIGDTCPKLGIGLLKKIAEGPYNFTAPYEIVETFPIDIDSTEDSVRFCVQPIDCRGYSARLIKDVTVQDNRLEIHYSLENTGDKVIATHEYCHNFIGIDSQPIGSDYRLHFPFDISFFDDIPAMRKSVPHEMRNLPTEELDRRIRAYFEASRNVLDIQGKDICLHKTPEMPFYCRPLGFHRTDLAQWELTHMPTGLSMREYDDFDPWRVAVWGVAHVISAEIFINFRLEPGQSINWTRRYEFNV